MPRVSKVSYTATHSALRVFTPLTRRASVRASHLTAAQAVRMQWRNLALQSRFHRVEASSILYIYTYTSSTNFGCLTRSQSYISGDSETLCYLEFWTKIWLALGKESCLCWCIWLSISPLLIANHCLGSLLFIAWFPQTVLDRACAYDF